MIALLREADRTWMAGAACREHDPDLWFPVAGMHNAVAQAICDSCPVRERCADYAEDMREQHGVWGGLNVEQRRQRARQREASHG